MATKHLDIDLTNDTKPATDDVVVLDTQDVVDADGDAATSGLPKNATVQNDGSIKLKLDYPVSLAVRRNGKTSDEAYDIFTLRRLTGQDLRKALSARQDLQPVILLSCCSGIPQLVAEKLFDKMDLSDIDAVSKVLDSFGKSGQKTGR